MSSALDVNREERPAYVRFEKRAIEDKAASLKAGRAVCKDVDYALVTPPYSKDCVEYKVETWLRNIDNNLMNGRIPKQWVDHWKASYQAWKEGQDEPVNGTDIKNWSAITPAEVKNIMSAGCRTVEDLAAANDQALRAIGMGANELKRKAQTYVQATKDHGPLVMKLSALQTENEQLRGTIESLQVQMQRLNGQMHNITQSRFEYEEDEPSDTISATDILDTSEGPDDASFDLEAARNLYKEKFGKSPHPSMKVETIMDKLN